MTDNFILDNVSMNSLVDLICDESQNKTEAIRNILKRKQFKYSATLDINDENPKQTQLHTERVICAYEPSKVTKEERNIQSYWDNKEKESAEVREKEEKLQSKIFKTRKALTDTLLSLFPKTKEIEVLQKQDMILKKYSSRLKFDDEGTCLNFDIVLQQAKIKISEEFTENKDNKGE